jgi:eukaryotic-like serine/threonine-protein kinase
MEYKPGDIIYGRYRIISVIGEGGFGKTYKVEDVQSPGIVCLIKYLSPQSNNPSVLKIAEERFRKEADILRRLGSYNQRVPQLYNYFEENQKFYLVQEYIEGHNLQEEITTQTLSEKQVIDALYDVLTTLDYLSINHVIHRDIKPANLVRRKRDNKIFLIDFGAVKEVAVLAVNHEGQTVATIAIGTPYYMPPEQRLGRPEFASDIYALGITALALLTGRIPQKNNTDEVIWNGIQVSQDFGKILEKMLRPQLYERYKTASEVLVDLEPLTLLGQTLNQHYHINRYLGTGELGYTYLAEDQQRPYEPNCIIKKLKRRTNNQQILEEVQNRFATATRKAEELSSHPQIPKLRNHFQANQEFYLVYDFIEGEALSKQITSGNRLNETEVITFLKDALGILSGVHSKDTIHGDVKPSNLIKRQQDGKIFLIDFAEFKQIVTLDINPQKIVVKPGGTDGYMPPEQLKNQLKPCSDIYALGMTAIQALTGISPDQLPIDSQGEVAWQNQAKVSPKLAKILTKMVRFQFGQRYQSAKEVLDALNSINPTNSANIGNGENPPSVSLGRQFRKYLPLLGIFIISTSILGWFSLKDKERLDSENKVIDLYNDAQTLLKNKEIDRAEQVFDEVLKIDPNYVPALVNRGFIYGQKKYFTKQLADCQNATQENNNFSSAWLCLGNAIRDNIRDSRDTKRRDADFNVSIQHFDKAINLACKSTEEVEIGVCTNAWFNKGELFLKLREPDKALKAFEEAIAKDPKDPKHHFSWTGKGKALLDQKSPKEALEAFNQALEFKKGYQPAIEGKQQAEKDLLKVNPQPKN